jgi:hypothetical protein
VNPLRTPIQYPPEHWRRLEPDDIRALAPSRSEAGATAPRVSIVTVCRNAARFLNRAIDSVLALDYPNIDYVVWDGASTDGTADILRRRSKEGLRWFSERDAATLDGLRRVLAHCRGEIIGVCWADDEVHPWAASWAVAAFADTGADVVYGDQAYVDHTQAATFLNCGPHWSLERMYLSEFFPNFSSTFFRAHALRMVLDRLLAFDHDEYEFWIQLGLTGRIGYVPGLVSSFHVEAGSRWRDASYVIGLLPGKVRAAMAAAMTREGRPLLAPLVRDAHIGVYLWAALHILANCNEPAAAMECLRAAINIGVTDDYRFALCIRRLTDCAVQLDIKDRAALSHYSTLFPELEENARTERALLAAPETASPGDDSKREE